MHSIPTPIIIVLLIVTANSTKQVFSNSYHLVTQTMHTNVQAMLQY